jgi:hypothetical protein
LIITYQYTDGIFWCWILPWEVTLDNPRAAEARVGTYHLRSKIQEDLSSVRSTY